MASLSEQATSEEIVALCQRGDRDAQRQLYETTHHNVYRLMVRMVGLQDAEDVMQQVYLQVFRSIAQFSGRSRLETWLYRLAANEALQHLRRNKRQQQCRPLAYEPVDRSVNHSVSTEHSELLKESLDRLDPELRCVFLLREMEGLAYREIADSLDLAEGTVGSQLNRARRQLRKHLIELGWEA